MPGVSQSYDHYLHLLRNKRSSNPYYNQTAKNLSRMTVAFKSANQKMAQRMNNNNAPESAVAQYNYDRSRQWNDMANEQMGDATSKDIERADQIDDKINELEFQKKEAVRLEKEKEKQRKDAQKRSLLQVGGQILGGVVGGSTGGLGGAQIGAGLGATAGSFVDNGLPQDFEMAMQGIQDTMKGFNYKATLKEDKAFNDSVSEAIRHLKSSDDIQELLMLLNLKGKGSYEALQNWIKQKK